MKIESNKIKKFLTNKTILIIGGAGSIGSSLTKKLLNYPVKSIRVLDVNEHNLFLLRREIPDVRFRPLLGSILDQNRLEMAINNVDIIINAAAVKNIEITEFNPMETIQVNTIGIMNIINIITKIKPLMFLNISTDKATEPTTMYGTTKQLGERLTSWAGVHLLPTKFGTVRFGNVIETKGNIFEVWNEEKKQNKPLTITDPKMERYFFHIDEATDFILNILPKTNRGEIFVPKMKITKIKEIADKISKNQKIIGKRQGEKLKEILISDVEKEISSEKEDMWVITYYKQGQLYP